MGDSHALDRLVRALRSSGLAGLAAGFLEAAGPPAAYLAAQGLYLAQPLLSGWSGGDALGELARALEDPAAVPQIVDRLKE